MFYCLKCGYNTKVEPLYKRKYDEDSKNGKFTPWISDGQRVGDCENCGVMPLEQF